MGPGAAGNPNVQAERRLGSLQEMSTSISELREKAMSVEVAARAVEKRLLGATSAEDAPDLAKVSESCLTAMVSSDAAAIRSSLIQIGNALEHITMELGTLGE